MIKICFLRTEITLIIPKNERKKASNGNFDNNSHDKSNVKRLQSISESHRDVKPVKSKILKSGANIEINEHYLDEILHNKNSQIELAMQIISNDKTVRNDTIKDLNYFNQQPLTTQAQKDEQLVSMMPAIKKSLNSMGDDIVELSVECESLKNQIGDYDDKLLQESKAKLIKDIDDEKRANLFMSRMKNPMNKNWYCLIPPVQIRIFVSIPYYKYKYNYKYTYMNDLVYL